MGLSFRKKLFFSISILIMVLMLICTVIFSIYTYQNLYRQSLQTLRQINEHTSSELKNLFESMDQLSLYISTNLTVRTAFSDAIAEDYSNSDLNRDTVELLTSVSIPNSASHFRISLYNRKGNFVSIGIPYSKAYTAEKLSSDTYAKWYDSLPITHNDDSLYGVHEDYWSDSGDLYFSLFREIWGKNSTAVVNGIIEIQCPISLVVDCIQSDDSSYAWYLFDQEGHLVFPEDHDAALEENLYQAALSASSGTLTSPEHLFYSSVSVRNGYSLVLAQSERHIWEIILPQVFAILAVGVGALICSIIILFYAVKRATLPILELTNSVKQVSIANLSLDTEFASCPDEIIALNQAFDKMLKRLKQSMDEIVRMQVCEIRANLVALQAQMDPHFLYNTLAVIKSLSREGNMVQIRHACDYLIKMLRYLSSYDEHEVSLKEELLHTEHYLNLMKIRFEDQFTYSVSIDSQINTETLMLPKLSLQPLVENCFQHGFKTVAPPWEIRISIHTEGARWFLQVADNGSGISPEAQEELHRKIDEFLLNPSDSMESLKLGGMGLINTVTRLRLKYKDKISFEISNQPQGGTVVTIGGMLDHEYFCS